MLIYFVLNSAIAFVALTLIRFGHGSPRSNYYLSTLSLDRPVGRASNHRQSAHSKASSATSWNATTDDEHDLSDQR